MSSCPSHSCLWKTHQCWPGKGCEPPARDLEPPEPQTWWWGAGLGPWGGPCTAVASAAVVPFHGGCVVLSDSHDSLQRAPLPAWGPRTPEALPGARGPPEQQDVASARCDSGGGLPPTFRGWLRGAAFQPRAPRKTENVFPRTPEPWRQRPERLRPLNPSGARPRRSRPGRGRPEPGRLLPRCWVCSGTVRHGPVALSLRAPGPAPPCAVLRIGLGAAVGLCLVGFQL